MNFPVVKREHGDAPFARGGVEGGIEEGMEDNLAGAGDGFDAGGGGFGEKGKSDFVALFDGDLDVAAGVEEVVFEAEYADADLGDVERAAGVEFEAEGEG